MTIRTNRYMSPNTGAVPNGIDEDTWICVVLADGTVQRLSNMADELYWRIIENHPYTILEYTIIREDTKGEYYSAMEKLRNGTPLEELDWEIIEYEQ